MRIIRVTRLAVAIIFFVSSMVSHAHALRDYEQSGYVDDLSSLPGLEIYQHKPSSTYSITSMAKWVGTNQMACAAGLTVAGFLLMYVTNSELRKKIDTWLGLRIELQDEISS